MRAARKGCGLSLVGPLRLFPLSLQSLVFSPQLFPFLLQLFLTLLQLLLSPPQLLDFFA